MTKYNGSPWRSRFLRSPKIGIELAGRDDFVSLGNPSITESIRLGMKTGNDDFFFLKVDGRGSSGSKLLVAGFNGWVGELPKLDLLPAYKTPKDYDEGGGGSPRYPVVAGASLETGTTFTREGRLAPTLTLRSTSHSEKRRTCIPSLS